MTPNQAAGLAIQLFRQEAQLCETHPPKVPRTHNSCRERRENDEKSEFANTVSPQVSSCEPTSNNKTPQSNVCSFFLHDLNILHFSFTESSPIECIMMNTAESIHVSAISATIYSMPHKICN